MKHTLSSQTQEQVFLQGQEVWRPSIAEPFYTTEGLPIWKRFNEKYWRPQCVCGKIFHDKQSFLEHYIYMAVWENESNYIPNEIANAIANAPLSEELKQESKK